MIVPANKLYPYIFPPIHEPTMILGYSGNKYSKLIVLFKPNQLIFQYSPLNPNITLSYCVAKISRWKCFFIFCSEVAGMMQLKRKWCLEKYRLRLNRTFSLFFTFTFQQLSLLNGSLLRSSSILKYIQNNLKTRLKSYLEVMSWLV